MTGIGKAAALWMAVVLTAVGAAGAARAEPTSSRVHHRTTTVDGVDLFYREAGPKDGPAICDFLSRAVRARRANR